jgi:hypothetical protein
VGALSRELRWDGCLNVRDLGGLPAADGAATRFGSVVRSDSVEHLSPAGWASAAAYGVRTVVDLRIVNERNRFPPLTKAPESRGQRSDHDIRTVRVSVLGDPDPGLGRHLDAIGARHTLEVEATRAVYAEMLDRFHVRFAEAVRVVADAGPGCVIVHCHAGKDRTGLVVALLLAVAGVTRDAIAADYAVSAGNLSALAQEWIDEAGDAAKREQRRRICSSPAQAMLDVLAALDSGHGGAEPYLTAGGLAEAELERIRERLLG